MPAVEDIKKRQVNENQNVPPRCNELLGISTKVVNRQERPAVRPVLLSYQRYDKLLYNAYHSADINSREDRKNQDAYLTDLKNQHLDMVQHFGANVAKSKEEKLQDIKNQIQDRVVKLRTSNQFNLDVLEQYRQQKLEKCEEMLKNNKPGIKELNAAVMHSEVIRAREIQKQINAEFEKAFKDNENYTISMDKKCDLQAPYLPETKKETENKVQIRNDYKKELMQNILDKKQKKIDEKNALLKEQIAEKERIDKEVQKQIAKEKAILDKKKSELRKNAAEAMRMAEERKQREKIFDTIDDRLNCVINVAQQRLKKKSIETRENIFNTNLKNKELLAEEVYKKIQASQKNYEDNLKKDVETQQLKFTAQEEEKRKREKSIKQARIEAYLNEMEKIKAANAQRDEEQRFDMAMRFKNTQVNALFEEQQMLARQREQQEVAATYRKQIDEKKAITRDLSSGFLNAYEKDDRYFFEYALKLMEDAQAEGRSLYPLAKVVAEFKKHNNIDCKREIPPHMRSNFKIGQKEPEVKENVVVLDECCELPDTICSKQQQKTTDKPLTQKLESKSEMSIKSQDLLACSNITLSENNEKKLQERDRKAVIENCEKITKLLEASQKNIVKCPVVKCFRDGLMRQANNKNPTALSPTPSALKWMYNKNELNSLNKEA